MSASKGDLSVDLQPLPPAWPLVESRCVGVVLLRSDGARPPGVLTEGCGLERARAPVWPSAAGLAGGSSATSTPWVVEARNVDHTLRSTRDTPPCPILLGLCTNVRRRSRARTSLHRAAARTCCARPRGGPIPSPWRGPSHSRDRGLVTAWRLAPPATVQVVGGDSNPPPTPPSPLVHILTCPVPVAWQVNLPLHLLQVLFNASFYISHLLLAADRSRNRSRATAAAATCRRPRHRPCPASSRRRDRRQARPPSPPGRRRRRHRRPGLPRRSWRCFRCRQPPSPPPTPPMDRSHAGPERCP